MITYFISILTKAAQKKYAEWHRFLCFIGTIVLIFLFFPVFFLYTGNCLLFNVHVTINPFVIAVASASTLLFGGVLIIWTLVLHYAYAQGSGSHIVPPKKLILFGPYKMSRHPMLLGAIFFYFGVCTIFASIVIGLYSAVTTAVLAYFFAVYVEEPVLIARFGQEYKDYQKKVSIVPFLFRCFDNSNRKHKSGN